MHIPIYTITGFLDAGKTTLLNRLMNDKKWQDAQTLIIQFESGEEAFSCRHRHCDVMIFPKRMLEQGTTQIVEQLHNYLIKNPIKQIWVEWNGVTPFNRLQTLFLHPLLHNLCRIEKVIHMADAEILDHILGKTGEALPEQMASCDFAVVRGLRSDQDYYRIRRIMRGVNPGVKLLRVKQTEAICYEILRTRSHPVNAFCIGILLIIAAYLIAAQVFNLSQTPVNTVINVFLGIMLQAVPFLLIGVIISSVIQVFIPKGAIEHRFPKKIGWGMAIAILAGFCLPVCDCASIPIFRSLVRKGVPLSAAVTFMAATPVINPVVILSTYYAFNGNPRIVAARVGLGIIAAVLIGLWFSIHPTRGKLLNSSDMLMCSCGCYDGADGKKKFGGKFGLFLRHSQAEFFNVGKYLMIGAFVASLFQTMSNAFSFRDGMGFAVSLLAMMIMAFLLSLCSSSDAVIARSFASSFPLEAVMGFLVFGPMIDIKNVIMLSGSFSKRFIVKLLAVAFAACFTVVFLLARLFVGG